MHNKPCATLLRRFGTIRAQGWQRTTRDDTLCDHLRCLIPFYNTLQCSLSLLRPFLTFSDTFRPFATFLDFALFNTPPFCVAFSGTFHQTLFTWLVHHSFGFSAIISVRSALRFTDILRFILLLQLYLCFLLPPLPKRTEKFPLRPYYSVLTSDLIAPLVVVVLTRVSCISHRLLSPFLEIRRTVSTDLSLTWTTLSDHFRVPYHHIYTLILPPFHCKR